MPLAERSCLLAKLEADGYGEDPTVAVTDAVRVKNLTWDQPFAEDERPSDGQYQGYGAQPSVIGQLYTVVEFDLELRGNSSNLSSEVEPIYGRFVRACDYKSAWSAVAETHTYSPNADGETRESIALSVHDDQVSLLVLGCRGSFTLDLPPGKVGMFHFRFEGLACDVTQAAYPAAVYTGEVTPPIVAGTSFAPFGWAPDRDAEGLIRACKIDAGVQLHRAWSETGPVASYGLASVRTVGRQPTVSIQAEQPAGTDAAMWYLAWRNREASASASLAIGTAANNRHLVTLAKLIPKQVKRGELETLRSQSIDCRAHYVNGNDHITITAYKAAAA
jgi:hypothetical protein